MDIISSLDEIDRKIMEFLQKDPTMTHSTIAEALDRSQPAIGARIKKLQSSGLLATQVGLDFKQIDEMNLVMLQMKTNKTDDIMELAEFCPFIINALKTSGDFNLVLLLASANLKQLDCVVDRHFRNKTYVKRIDMNLITGVSKPFILPVNLASEEFANNFNPCKDHPICAKDRELAGKRSPEQLQLT